MLDPHPKRVNVGCAGDVLPAVDDTVPLLGCGGDDGTRTHDPLLAKQVLFQLSYIPEKYVS
jgi:hypothetical protein